jgi:hypothetical protein
LRSSAQPDPKMASSSAAAFGAFSGKLRGDHRPAASGLCHATQALRLCSSKLCRLNQCQTRRYARTWRVFTGLLMSAAAPLVIKVAGECSTPPRLILLRMHQARLLFTRSLQLVGTRPKTALCTIGSRSVAQSRARRAVVSPVCGGQTTPCTASCLNGSLRTRHRLSQRAILPLLPLLLLPRLLPLLPETSAAL